MILDFNNSKKTGELSWKFKGNTYKVKIEDAKIVKNYEFLEKVFVIKVENRTSVLYVYDAEGNLYDKIVSKPGFFIKGMRGGILQPEFLITAKDKEPTIFIYDAKKKTFVNTGEIIPRSK